MADTSLALVQHALHRAASAATGAPLFGAKAGLFASTAAGKEAAKLAQADGLIQILRSEKRGKRTIDIAGITKKGLERLGAVGQDSNPARSIGSCRAGLESCPTGSVNGHAKSAIEAEATLLDLLGEWHVNADCPLPELYRQTSERGLPLTIGQFHDTLRRLHDERQIYLHPWTGPLYELPEPACALLVGHEIAYYASLRS